MTSTMKNTLLLIDGDKQIWPHPWVPPARANCGLPKWNRVGTSNVICIRPRARVSPGDTELLKRDDTEQFLREKLETYGHEFEEKEDHHHRMLMNVLAIGVLTALIITGDWVLNTLASVT
jgi:hypothetical protein